MTETNMTETNMTETNMNETNMTETQDTQGYYARLSNPAMSIDTHKEIMRFDLNGGFTVDESVPATETAAEVIRILKEQWFADAQATKIRELEDRVTELEDLWYRSSERKEAKP